MTRRPRTEALLKDIARLFVTYDKADWTPFLDELRQGSDLQRRVAAAIEELGRDRLGARSKTSQKRKAVATQPAARKWAHPERAPVLEKLEAGLRSRILLRDPKALREVLARTGAKDAPSSARAAAITALVALLDEMPVDRFTELVEAIEQSSKLDQRDFDGDYARWFTLILDRPSRATSLAEIHDTILSLMDQALVRGALKFPVSDESRLTAERDRWLAKNGSPSGVDIIDRFLKMVRFARHAGPRDQKRLDAEVHELKQNWRELSPRSK